MTTNRPLNVVIVGGHGKVPDLLPCLHPLPALTHISFRLVTLLTSRPNTTVTTLVRKSKHIPDVQATGANPIVLPLEDASVYDLVDAFAAARADIVYFVVGAGGKGGPERTRRVDEEGAIKVFDAIESFGSSMEERPRLITVSAIDVRDEYKGYPTHYTDDDIQWSKRIRAAVPAYMQAKYNANKNLVSRTGFRWTILRPGVLYSGVGEGRGIIGKAHLARAVSLLPLNLERSGMTSRRLYTFFSNVRTHTD
ncbi:NADH(P)-binding-domain-containing protein [Irpex lacteus]|nr:NADH(P)-binding-domain-containing protein [Irpex lacteus]